MNSLLRLHARKSDQLFYRYVLAVEANERPDVQQRMWDEFVMQLVVEDRREVPPLQA